MTKPKLLIAMSSVPDQAIDLLRKRFVPTKSVPLTIFVYNLFLINSQWSGKCISFNNISKKVNCFQFWEWFIEKMDKSNKYSTELNEKCPSTKNIVKT